MSDTRASFDLNSLSQQVSVQAETQIPPVDQWNPDFCGDIDLRIARNGQWLYMGTPIGRPRMVDLFARVLWLEEGRYYLKTPVEKIGIQVDGLPFLVISVEQKIGVSGPELWFTTHTGDHFRADAEHPIRVITDAQTGEPEPAVMVRFGMEALINRTVFYQLVELARLEPCAQGEQLIVESAGQHFSLGQV